MSRNTIAAIWIAGIVLALLVYAAGPDRFVFATYDLFARAWWGVYDLLVNFSIAAFDLVRAAAIGLWGVFAALAVVSIVRGGRGRAALVALSVVFFGLIWHAAGDGFGAHTRWLAALALAAAGALSMTRRLTQPAAPAPQPGAAPRQPGP